MAIETERKYSTAAETTVPDLSSVVARGATRTHDLRAVYFDTPDFLLARNKRTLRRRTGGSDAGWHLKLPASGDSRHELHAALTEGPGSRRVPVELRREVADIIRYAPLVPVLDLATSRLETDLTDDAGTVLAQLCDDTVTATRAAKVRSWRELEVELVGDGDVALLDRISELLQGHGISPSASVSKLVQGLGKALARAEEGLGLNRKSSAAEVVGAYFAEQVGVIQGREPEVRVDAPDSVHKMRVAVRRLRSALRTFRPILDVDRTRTLRTELRWLGAVLGGPRDAEVLSARLIDAASQLPEDAQIGPVVERIRAELSDRHAAAHADLVTALDSDRYLTLSDALVGLLTAPPFNEFGAARAKGLLPERLEQVGRRTLKEWKQAEKLSGEARQEAWHETRKRAKATRYAWEAAVPALGERAVAAASAWEGITEALGTVQDAVVARETLKDIARAAESDGESAFSYGVLYEREIDRTAGFHAESVAAVKNAKKFGFGG